MAGSVEGIATDGLAETVEGEGPTQCRYCEQRFADGELLALHRGLEHESGLADEERVAFERAYEREANDLRVFRLKALLALMGVYFLFLFAYSVFG